MKGNGLKLDGDVNYRTFAGNMMREYPNQLRLKRNLQGLQPNTRNLLDSVRALTRTEDVLPSSGTAERLSMADLTPNNMLMQAGGSLATKGYLGLSGTATGQSLQTIPYKQIFNTQATGPGLLEAYAASLGVGLSQ